MVWGFSTHVGVLVEGLGFLEELTLGNGVPDVQVAGHVEFRGAVFQWLLLRWIFDLGLRGRLGQSSKGLSQFHQIGATV